MNPLWPASQVMPIGKSLAHGQEISDACLSQNLPELLNTKDIQHTLEVVAQHHQAEFTVDRFAATDEKVIPAAPALEGTEAASCSAAEDWDPSEESAGDEAVGLGGVRWTAHRPD